MIITSPQHTSTFVNTLGDGSRFGARFTYATQVNLEGAAQAFIIGEEFLEKESVCFITGDCIILGDDRSNKLRKAIRAAKNCSQATIFVSKDYDLSENKLQVQILGNNFRWFDTNTFDTLLAVSNYIQKASKTK